VWALAVEQWDVIAHRQLIELGYRRNAIEHRLATGRLHRKHLGVYAVGRPTLTRYGRWMAAVLACGPRAALSHDSAAALWGIGPELSAEVHVSVPAGTRRRHPGIKAHRRIEKVWEHVTEHERIPVTSIDLTLVDLATRVPRPDLERAVNEADRLDLISPDDLRAALDLWTHHPGVRPLRELLDEATFTLTDSELERLFLPIARSVGLPKPITRQWVNGFRVDFFWPELRLVVETDGLRYHRTPLQQARDSLRDHAHLAAGLTPVRFTHHQIRYRRGYVRERLTSIVGRLRSQNAR
jgi:very-short-patch-repair endonuclease